MGKVYAGTTDGRRLIANIQFSFYPIKKMTRLKNRAIPRIALQNLQIPNSGGQFQNVSDKPGN
ncbi:MAG TPA: hypothetical protein VGB68_08800 [Pyrinomonadaceae bacterium]|jgi:hypothetical protein